MSGRLRAARETEVRWGEWLSIGAVTTKNSPLWKTNPKQQMGYLQVKNWARAFAPGAILGVYTTDELGDAEPMPQRPAQVAEQARRCAARVARLRRADFAKNLPAWSSWWPRAKKTAPDLLATLSTRARFQRGAEGADPIAEGGAAEPDAPVDEFVAAMDAAEGRSDDHQPHHPRRAARHGRLAAPARGLRHRIRGAAALGVGKYVTRTQLLRRKFTGVAEEHSPATLGKFAAGHAAEARSAHRRRRCRRRSVPVTMSLEIAGLRLLASLDDPDARRHHSVETKLWNEELAADVRAGTLPEHYRADGPGTSGQWRDAMPVQLHRCTPERFVSCWYEPDPSRFDALVDRLAALPSGPAGVRPCDCG